ncbi:hypothetical protein CRG98_041725 [Punica granatum]|uniref:Uncharacterized protein n=1 Tax=Punica granatum TaxID=22663 RepID=A0A2I0I232_PUNGR|nr:hypothetical protein CRG98_041725 [Punica granatum]
MNLRCRKATSQGLENLARLQEARARWLGELTVQEMKLARVSRLGKVARGTSEKKHERGGSANLRCKIRQGCKRHERGGSANLRCKKVNLNGLADPARLQEARVMWLGELAVQEIKLAWVSDLARLQEARARWLYKLAVQEISSHGLADRARLQGARARWLGELAVQESKLTRVSRPDKVARGRSEVARRTCGSRKKVSSHGLADRARLQGARARWLGELAVQENPARLQEARARWFGELAVQESKHARVSRPGEFARGTNETRQDCKRHEGGGSANLRRRKVSSHGLAGPARLQEARARWLGELARKRHERGDSANLRRRKESKLVRVSRPGKVGKARVRRLGELAVQESCKRHERGGSANLRCKKVNSNEIADPARLQEARARCLGELAVQEMNLARASRPGKVARGTSEAVRRTCSAGKKVSSHRLADPARLQGARARWFGELAVQESKHARVSRPGKFARGTNETRQDCKRHEGGGSANLRRRKVGSHGLADPARLQEARARWLGELAAQESRLARVSRSGKVARSTGEVARRTCDARK